MKKYISVFGLFAKSTIFKILLVIFAMLAVEFTFFHFELENALETYEIVGSGMTSLERTFSKAATNVYFRFALVFITIILCLPGCSFKSNTGYILKRLSISERGTFFIQALYNSIVYLALLAIQLSIAFALSQYYVSSVPPECISNQTVILAFYRSNFLHSLLPLEDIGLWIRNALLILLFGLVTAEFPFRQRRHKFSSSAIALIIYTICYYDQSIGQLFHVITTTIIALLLVGEAIYVITRKDEEDEQDEQDN